MPEVFAVRMTHTHERMTASYDRGGDGTADPGEQFWGVYPTRQTAERAARELDHADMTVNGTDEKPFAGGFAAATTFPVYALRDWMLDADIPVPDGDTITDWRLWWIKMRDADRPISRPQFRHLLAALNRMSLSIYEVVPVPVAPEVDGPGSVFAVIDRRWMYDDEKYDGDNTPLAVYRTREEAEAYREGLATGPRPRLPDRWSDAIEECVVIELPVEPEEG